jgi:hypothetical protein
VPADTRLSGAGEDYIATADLSNAGVELSSWAVTNCPRSWEQSISTSRKIMFLFQSLLAVLLYTAIPYRLPKPAEDVIMCCLIRAMAHLRRRR